MVQSCYTCIYVDLYMLTTLSRSRVHAAYGMNSIVQSYVCMQTTRARILSSEGQAAMAPSWVVPKDLGGPERRAWQAQLGSHEV